MSIEEINELIKHKQWELLVQIGEPAVVPLIASLARIKFSSIRFLLATLGDIGDRRGVNTLIQFINIGDYYITSSAIKSLGKIGDPTAVESLIKVLISSNKNHRRESAKALGMIGDPKAIELLNCCLSDPDKHLQLEAALALIKIDNARATNCLIRYILDKKNSFWENLRNHLAKIFRLTELQSWAITVRDNCNWSQ